MSFDFISKKSIALMSILSISLLTFCKTKDSDPSSSPSPTVSKNAAEMTEAQKQLQSEIDQMNQLLQHPPVVPTTTPSGTPDYAAIDYNKIADILKTSNTQLLTDIVNSNAFAGLKESYYANNNTNSSTATTMETDTGTETGTDTNASMMTKISSYLSSAMYEHGTPGHTQLTAAGAAFFVIMGGAYNLGAAIGADIDKGRNLFPDRKLFGSAVLARGIAGLGLGAGNIILAGLGYAGTLTDKQFDNFAGALVLIDGVTTLMVGGVPLFEKFYQIHYKAETWENRTKKYAATGSWADLMMDPLNQAKAHPGNTITKQDFWKEYYEILDDVDPKTQDFKKKKEEQINMKGEKVEVEVYEKKHSSGEIARLNEMKKTGEISKAWEVHRAAKHLKPKDWIRFSTEKQTKLLGNPYRKFGLGSNRFLWGVAFGGIAGFGAVLTAGGAVMLSNTNKETSLGLADGTDTKKDPREDYFAALGDHMLRLFKAHDEVYGH